MWTDVVFVRSIPDVTEHIPTLLEQWFANEVRRPQGFREGTSKGPRVPQRHSPPSPFLPYYAGNAKNTGFAA